MSGTVKSKKVVKVRHWFKQHTKLMVVGFFCFVALSLVALSRGIGYEATANITSTHILVDGHPCLGYLVEGNLVCTFNPVLYPVTNIFGYENNMNFASISEPYDSVGKSVKERKEVWAAFPEFLKNVPYYLAISLATAFGASKLIERFRRKSPA